MKKSIILLVLLFLNISFTCFAGSRGGAAFGGSFAGSLLGTTLATAATRPRTVTVREVSGGVKYSDLRDVENRIRDDVARDLRQMQVNVDDIIRFLRDDIRRLSDDLDQLRKELDGLKKELSELGKEPEILKSEKEEK